jgi:quercetin dioxygenase-like cupin family protein
MSVAVLYYVIEGQGAIRVMDEQGRLQTGSLVIVPAGAVRSISADTRMRVLAMQVP